MPPTTSIPRFLLPQRGAIWRTRLSVPTSISLTIRSASNKKKNSTSKPLVLEKPSKFVPPSHPARLRKEAPRYPGPQLSDEEIARQTKKKYPNMMPPEGTFMHWFMMNKTIHMWITLGTLFALAGTVWITNFKRRSPFADMLPSWTQLFIHPIACTRTFLEVLKLDSERTTAETMERRKRKVEDVQKRAAYRKAHGMETDESFGGWTAKSDGQLLGPGMPIGDVEGEQTEQARPKKPLKKWLGIW
ncbi:hypothetical protein NA56DRAFT_568375 [Hyaloscypha hepaticicola]|uniref:Uncharacterized protein n=1 Tax=Hyaloscypha hepaticicola TaxID=2082293 RepID=A0A2J6QC41_9HELO|nr:hypothetical protein NA56DRAFT_568375 [Hyaloscypha hepaticicola]